MTEQVSIIDPNVCRSCPFYSVRSTPEGQHYNQCRRRDCDNWNHSLKGVPRMKEEAAQLVAHLLES